MAYLITIIIIALDQVTKSFALGHLRGKAPIVVIEGIFELIYVENRGAAFGILQEKRILFIVITFIVILSLMIYTFRNYNQLTVFSKIIFTMLIGGAAGNLIDRIRFGYVVDFIKINLIGSYNFPVFNIADIFIVISTILLAFVVLFDKYEAK